MRRRFAAAILGAFVWLTLASGEDLYDWDSGRDYLIKTYFGGTSCQEEPSFDPSRWRASGPSERTLLVPGLVCQHAVRELSRTELEDLLGPPDAGSFFTYVYRFQSSQPLRHAAPPPSQFKLIPGWYDLVISLNGYGHVVAIRVTEARKPVDS